jgi:hypothetical protein
MQDFIMLVIVLGLWFFIQRWFLPKLGIRT